MTITIPFNLTPAQKTKLGAIVAGVSSGLAWLFSLDPSDQVAALKPIIGILPPGWHGYVGGFFKVLFAVSLVYTFIKAHRGTPAAQMAPEDIEALAQRLSDVVYSKLPADAQMTAGQVQAAVAAAAPIAQPAVQPAPPKTTP